MTASTLPNEDGETLQPAAPESARNVQVLCGVCADEGLRTSLGYVEGSGAAVAVVVGGSYAPCPDGPHEHELSCSVCGAAELVTHGWLVDQIDSVPDGFAAVLMGSFTP